MISCEGWLGCTGWIRGAAAAQWMGWGRLQSGPGTPENAARGHWDTRDTSETEKKKGTIKNGEYGTNFQDMHLLIFS